MRHMYVSGVGRPEEGPLGQRASWDRGLTGPGSPQLYLRELLRLMHLRFYQHLVSLGEDGLQMLFCHRWLLLCFKREFPEAEALRIWEACWAHYQVSRGRAGQHHVPEQQSPCCALPSRRAGCQCNHAPPLGIPPLASGQPLILPPPSVPRGWLQTCNSLPKELKSMQIAH